MQERPCTRCIKRNIGHLCHDQPRETDTKKPKSGKAGEEADTNQQSPMPNAMGPPPNNSGFDGSRQQRPNTGSAFGPNVLGNANPMLVGPAGGTDLQGAMSNSGNVNQCMFFFVAVVQLVSCTDGISSRWLFRCLVDGAKLSRHELIQQPQLHDWA